MSWANWEEVGARIAFLREKKGLKQSDLAKVIGRSPQTMSNIENGRRSCPPDALLKICDYFHVSLDWLLGRKKDPESDEPKEIDHLLKNGNLKYKDLLLTEKEIDLIKHTLDLFVEARRKKMAN
jgi:transcriptional regulator with XRE-family HTH domain